jgi:tRNA threonylcarbamoyladenosine biosynthesis protein TsaB
VKILAFDTATIATTAALLDTVGDMEIEARDDPSPGQRPGHTAKLLPLVAEVLDRAGCDWGDIDRLAVGVGPGTFTGLRIGVATARALAQARQVSLVGVSTLQSLALGAADGLADDRSVLGVIDARRGEVFAGAWPAPAPSGGAWEPALVPTALAPDALADVVRQLGAGPLAVGDGAVAFRAVLECSGAVIPEDASQLHRVSALNHCRLAGTQAPPPDQDGIRPQYLRLPDAELARRVAQGT